MNRLRLYLASSRALRKVIRDLRAELAEAHTLCVEMDRARRREELRANDWEARWCDATFDTLKPRLRSER